MGVKTWLPFSRPSEGQSFWTAARWDIGGSSSGIASLPVNISSSMSPSSNLIDLAETELDLRFLLMIDSGFSKSSTVDL